MILAENSEAENSEGLFYQVPDFWCNYEEDFKFVGDVWATVAVGYLGGR